MKKPAITTPLDHRLRPCIQADAKFQSSQSRNKEILEAYTDELATTAEAWAASQPPNPLGSGNKKATILSGFHLRWDGTCWLHEKTALRIEISPNCDKEQTLQCLKSIQAMQPLFAREIIHREQIRIQIGTEPERPCIAFAKGNTIGIPFAKDGCHLLAPSLCTASPEENIQLQNIILHEVGHTLGKYLQNGKEEIRAGIGRHFKKLAKELEKISPHYLGKQSQAITLDLAAKTAASWADPENEKQLNETERKLTSEIFAEAVRYYYLEPILNGKKRAPIKTGFWGFDEFLAELAEDAKITMEQNLNGPPFPKKGEAPEI